MKKVKLLNWLLVLFVVFTSFNYASCSDDDNWGGGNSSEQPGDPEPNLAGDDFYAYVNDHGTQVWMYRTKIKDTQRILSIR